MIRTTTKQTVVKDSEGVRHDVHEKIEDLTPGGSGLVTVSTTSKEVCYLSHYAKSLHKNNKIHAIILFIIIAFVLLGC